MSDSEQLAKITEVLDRMIKDHWEVYSKHMNIEAGAIDQGKINHVKFARLSLIGFAKMSSILAVDTYMTEDEFVSMCRENYRLADSAAPKFK